jgi:Protein of unknown function (DUF2934)
MAREKKATGDAPKKRTSRNNPPVAAAEQVKQQSPDNGNLHTMQAPSAGNNGGSASSGNHASNIGDEVIRQRAYEIWEQRGCQDGQDADDWFRAESEVRGKSA